MYYSELFPEIQNGLTFTTIRFCCVSFCNYCKSSKAIIVNIKKLYFLCVCMWKLSLQWSFPWLGFQKNPSMYMHSVCGTFSWNLKERYISHYLKLNWHFLNKKNNFIFFYWFSFQIINFGTRTFPSAFYFPFSLADQLW